MNEEQKSNPLVGDGYCQDQMNTANCNFDGGDCCGSCIIRDHCSDCICHEKDSDDFNPLLGNGYCDDQLNKEDCNYDGGDCCLSCREEDTWRSTFCDDCLCYEGGIVTSNTDCK